MSNPDYHRAYMRRRRRERRAWAVRHLGGKCVMCERIDDLEFAHKRDRSLTGDRKIGAFLAGSLERLIKELRKVRLLCPACHMADDGRIDPEDIPDYRHVSSVTCVYSDEVPF